MKPIMYLFLNRDLGMSKGKACAQVAHAAVESYKISKREMIAAWELGGHMTKIVMLAENTDQLDSIGYYVQERGFKMKMIIDEGRTEIAPFSPTAIGVEIVDKDDPHTAATFESFKVYKDEPQQNGEVKLTITEGAKKLFKIN